MTRITTAATVDFQDGVEEVQTAATLQANSRSSQTLTLAADVTSTVVARLAIIGLGLTTSILTARLLLPAGRGEYFVVVTLAQTFAQFGNLGLQSSNSYLVARNRELLGELLANSFWTAVIAGIGSLLVVGGLMVWGGPQLQSHGTNLWFAAILAPVILFHMLGSNLLVGINAIRTFNHFQVGSSVIVLLLLFVAGWFGSSPTVFLAAATSGWLIGTCWLWATLRRMSGRHLRFRPDVFRAGFSFAAKAYLATLLGFLVLRSNVFFLRTSWGTEEVGHYSIATQLADLLAILPQSASLVLFPNLVTNTHDRFNVTIKSLVTVGALLGVGCLLVASLADAFIGLAFGSSFLPAVPIVQTMLPGVLCVGLTAVASQYLAAHGFPRSLVGVWVFAMFCVTSLSWFLVPRWGGVGAAAALSITHGLIFSLILSLCWRMGRVERWTTR